MTDIVENGGIGVFPPGFTDPVANPDVPWAVAADADQPDPVPVDRLDEEPADVKAEDRGQQVADELAAVPEKPGSGDVGTAGGAVPGIDLRDYSRDAQQKGWGAPCSARRATVTLRAARVTVDVRLAELVGLIMPANEAQGYVYRAADTGAYNCRKIAGTTRWSNHAWGIAIDENWTTNPFTSPLTTDKPRWLIDRWNRYGFAWGGDYSGRKDPMHFEFMGSPAQAQAALELARRELGNNQEEFDMATSEELKHLIIGYGTRAENIEKRLDGQMWSAVIGYGQRVEQTEAAVAELAKTLEAIRAKLGA